MTDKFLQGIDASKISTDAAVGRRVQKLLDALDSINSHVAKGGILKACLDFQDRIVETLRSEGWRVQIKNDKWQVLPPK